MCILLYIYGTPTAVNLFSLYVFFLRMITIYDVLELRSDDLKLREWLKGYGVLKEPSFISSRRGLGSDVRVPWDKIISLAGG